jgi:tRNA A37 threonylcarbamoyladenosine synthetase subunit TsaC/SUA5/YrdC
MSPHLHYQIARAHQREIVSRAMNSHRSDDTRPAVNRHRSVKHRVAQVAVALGACLAAGTAIAATDVHSNQRPTKQHARHVSAQQLDREIRAFEAKGYVPTSCTVSGTLMRNYRTGQSVTVKW